MQIKGFAICLMGTTLIYFNFLLHEATRLWTNMSSRLARLVITIGELGHAAEDLHRKKKMMDTINDFGNCGTARIDGAVDS